MKLRTHHEASPTNATDSTTYPTEPVEDDHAMRACGETCARCNATFQPGDEVRRNVAGDCVHLDC
jgi:hypothetical protein